MAILTFQKPDVVVMLESDEKRGIFELRPLQPGFGITIGNALRRVLLSSLEGYAITSVKIEGVDQEFSTIKGVIEDVTEIVLKLKQIRFKKQIEEAVSEKVTITVGDQEVFKASDINKFLNNFQILNPELEICHMEKNVKLNIELTIDKGRGYVPADDNKTLHEGIGVIVIDSIHTPIRNVKYFIDNFRVEQKTDFEKLIIEILTDGSIHPKEALKEAAKILIQHFMLFSDEKISFEVEEKSITEEFDENSLHIRQILKTRLTELDLSVRALNCLKAAYIETLGDLVSYQKNDLLKFRNFGKKSLSELEDLVKSKGMEFGMNVDKYKLDKD
ncbi:MAG: DNA-directed RNA polymerase subunit alpha [Bacteroidales bacterium]|nr:DNA-directed RNA polymerase subunit alpha [Bacteroidales bacterium]MDY0216199.1 DNA-directed RNA polymerase subunit alpha [Bacteroidales bacterium]